MKEASRNDPLKKSAVPRRSVNEPKFTQWKDRSHGVHLYEFHTYMHYVAEARVIIRKVQRIIGECARKNGLEPLEHQALIQIYGSKDQKIAVGKIGHKLDVSPALASRLVQQLEAVELVRRARSSEDRRATYVSATKAGIHRLYAIVEDVHREVSHFNSKLASEQQQAALEIFTLYIGTSLPNQKGT